MIAWGNKTEKNLWDILLPEAKFDFFLSFLFAGLCSRVGAVMKAVAWPCCWVEFVRSLLCSQSFFSGYFGFPLSPKTNIQGVELVR